MDCLQSSIISREWEAGGKYVVELDYDENNSKAWLPKVYSLGHQPCMLRTLEHCKTTFIEPHGVFISCHLSPDMTEVYGYSALHNAVITRDVKAVRILTATPGVCDLESQDSMGFTPLHLATLQGKQDLVQMLVLAGCDINSRTKVSFLIALVRSD